jgi:hypothetical protein
LANGFYWRTTFGQIAVRHATALADLQPVRLATDRIPDFATR